MRKAFGVLLAVVILSVWGTPSSKADSPLSYDQLKGLIDSRHIGTVDDLIPALPEDCRKHVVLVYKSRSVQYADATNPRVILSCNDGKLMLAYSGDPNKASSNTVEVIRFDDSSRSFKFTEITFSQSHAHYDETGDSCAQCHGENRPHPILDTYNLWPGVYGSENGQIAHGSREDQAFRGFLQARQSNPGRFGSLIGINSPPSSSAAYLPSNDFSVALLNAQLSKLNFDGVIDQITGAPGFSRYKYAMLAGAANCDGIESYIPASESARVRALYPGGLAELVSETDRANKSYVLGKLTRQAEAGRGMGEPPFKQPDLNSSYYDPGRHGVNGYSTLLEEPIAKLRYLMTAQGQSTDEWFMPRDPQSYSFDDGGHGHFQLVARLEREVLRTDPELASYFDIRSEKIGDSASYEYDRDLSGGAPPKPELCSKLKQKSLAAFGGTSAGNCAHCGAPDHLAPVDPSTGGTVLTAEQAAAALLHRGRTILQRKCMTCHAQGSQGAPKLPLSEDLGLRDALRGHGQRLFKRIRARIRSNDPDEQMPPQEGLAPDDRKALEDYLKDVMR